MKRTLLYLLPLILFLGCNKNKPFSFGEINDNKYNNPFFNIKLELDSSFSLYGHNQYDEIDFGDNNFSTQLLKTFNVNTQKDGQDFLFFANKTPDFDSNILILASNLEGTIDDLEEHEIRYLKQYQKLNELMPDLSFSEIRNAQLGKNNYKSIICKLATEGPQLSWEILVTSKNDYLVVISIMTIDDVRLLEESIK